LKFNNDGVVAEMDRKVLVIGLDCASPYLVFNEFLHDMPNIKKLMKNGIYGILKSCHPPITIPAWMVMCTSTNAGKLGIYGFRHRKDFSYKDIWIANSKTIKKDTIWNVLSKHGKKCCIIGVTPTYPPKKINGWLISGFITPDSKKDYTYPPSLKKEIEKLVGEYKFDVKFRTDRKDELLHDIYDMTEKRFKVVKYLIENKDWDFFMFVEIGIDRLYHGFWKFYDKNHHLYVPNNRYENVIREYHKYFDTQIGEILSIIDKNTVVFVVSDHGAKRMKGCVCVNEWLIREGYLVLNKKPEGIISLDDASINWQKTTAWGWGGYYARIFLNMKGREKEGVVPPEKYEIMRTEIAHKLKALRDPAGLKMDTIVFRPEDIYKECKGSPPDLMVYFDNLSWRAAGTVGHNTLYLSENDTGPDDAVHDWNGIFIKYDPHRKIHKKIDIDILDVAPTILDSMGVQIPSDMEGKIIR
jgi:predicted AlkP superfamily phosphohydrolase/phosphomutase